MLSYMNMIMGLNDIFVICDMYLKEMNIYVVIVLYDMVDEK